MSCRRNSPKRAENKLRCAERRKRALEMFLAGNTIRTIAATLEVSQSSVWVYLRKRVDYLQGAADECADEIRRRQIDQVNTLILNWWPQAQRDKHAAELMLRLWERQAKLMGLDAPTKGESSGSPDVAVLLRAELTANPAALRAALAQLTPGEVTRLLTAGDAAPATTIECSADAPDSSEGSNARRG